MIRRRIDRPESREWSCEGSNRDPLESKEGHSPTNVDRSLCSSGYESSKVVNQTTPTFSSIV